MEPLEIGCCLRAVRTWVIAEALRREQMPDPDGPEYAFHLGHIDRALHQLELRLMHTAPGASVVGDVAAALHTWSELAGPMQNAGRDGPCAPRRLAYRRAALRLCGELAVIPPAC